VTWSRALDDPIPLPDGRSIETLREAGQFIVALGKARERPEWQAAAEVVLMAAEGKGPLMHARIGVLRALNAGKPDPKLSPRKKKAKTFRIVR
jgi:hypothetical protein